MAEGEPPLPGPAPPRSSKDCRPAPATNGGGDASETARSSMAFSRASASEPMWRSKMKPETRVDLRQSMAGKRQQSHPALKMINKLNDYDEQLQDICPQPMRVLSMIIVWPMFRAITSVLKWWYDGFLTFGIETCTGFWCMYALPYQLAFQNPVGFDEYYVISYLFDFLMLMVKCYPIFVYLNRIFHLDGESHFHAPSIQQWGIQSMHHLMHRQSSFNTPGASNRRSSRKASVVCPAPNGTGHSPSVVAATVQRAQAERLARIARRRKAACRSLFRALVRLIPFLPFDLFLWGSEAQWLVPYTRFIRFLYAPRMVHNFHTAVEASQLMSFTASRYMRVIVVFALATHWLGCIFFFASERANATHYMGAPWYVAGYNETQGAIAAPKKLRYLWANYWSMMSLTTTGHVDIIKEEGREWEVFVAMVVVLFSTFCFTYMNANITSLIMRHTQTLDRYRVRLSQVDGYLSRNQVSKDVRRLVKRHFQMSFDDERLKDQALLDQMPHGLRKKVMYDIHMRTMRRVPVFFGCEAMMLQHLCNVVKRVVLLPDTTLCSQGDVMTEMYFLEAGTLSVYEETVVIVEPTEISAAEPAGSGTDGTNLDGTNRTSMTMTSIYGTPSMRESPSMSVGEKASLYSPDLAAYGEEDKPLGSVDDKDKSEGTDTEDESLNSGTLVKQKSLKKGMSRARFNLPAESVPEEPEVLEDKESKLVETPGSSLAEAAFFFGVRQDVTVEAIRPTSCLVLSKGDCSTILRDFPDAEEKICANIKQRLKLLERWAVLASIERAHGKTKEQVATIADLFNACARGDLSTAQDAVNTHGISLAETDYEGRSCLHIAASAGQLAVVEWLLDSNAGVNKKDLQGKTALEIALQHNHVKVVKLLSSKGGLLGWEPAEEGFHLCDAVSKGHLYKLKLMLDCGVSPDSPTFDQRCALHHAAAEGNVKAIELLLGFNAALNPKDRWGGTPLRDAVRGGHNKAALMIKKNGGVLAYDDVQAAAELCEQARASNLSGIRLLIDCGVDSNAADYDKRTALHLAASTGNLAIAKHLLKREADVNVVDRWGCTPLRDAVREGHREVALMLRSHGGNLGYNEAEASAELCELARQGNTSFLEVLIECGAPVNAMDYNKRTCLHLAANVGNLSAVELLLSKNADVNPKDRWGCTPLREAVREGQKSVAYLLRDNGGELALAGGEASMQLGELTHTGSTDLLRLMIACGAPVDAADFNMRTSLHLACSIGNETIVSILLDSKADINYRDRFKHTPLVDAVRHGHVNLAMMLHSRGAVLGLDDVQVSGRLCELVRQGNLELLKVFLACGADVNVADYDSRTGLHLAASEGNVKVVRALVDAKADVNVRDGKGSTPLYNAVRNGHPDVAMLLREHGAELGLDDVQTSAELCELARQGSLETMKVLLSCGANVNAADYDLRTCLHVAASEGTGKVVHALIEMRADLNCLDRWGSTPLRDAMRYGHLLLASELREQGGELCFSEKDAASELCDLAKQGSTDLIRMMIKCGIDVNAADYDLRTCLHIAASEGMPQVVETLIGAGAEVNAKDRWGNTPLCDALRGMRTQVMTTLIDAGGKLLQNTSDMASQMCSFAREGRTDPLVAMLTCGAPVDAADYDGRTALHLAACEGHKSVVTTLVKWKGKPDMEDRWGNTPLSEAARVGHKWDASIWA